VTEPLFGRHHSPRILFISILLGVGAAAAMQGLAIGLGGWPFLNGEFLGPDPYMRLSRVIECRGGFWCADGLYPRSNYPFGETLQWPFLLDWILLVLSAPFVPFLGLAASVTLAGYALGPLLEVLAVVLVTLVARPLVPPPGIYFVGLFLGLQLWALLAFSMARPDHHGLQALLFLGAVAAAVPVMMRRASHRNEALCGVALALAVWVSVEGLISLTPVMVALGVLWLTRGTAEAARSNRRIYTAALAVLLLGLLVDGPEPTRLSPDLDRFSVVHCTLFAAVLAFWLLAERFSLSAVGRLVSALAGAGVTVLVLSALFPGFIQGPMANVDPRLWSIWIDFVSEFRSVGMESNPEWLLLSMGPLVPFLLVSAWLGIRGSPEGRAVWLFLLGAGLWLGGLAWFLQVRWTYYIHMLVPVALAWLLGRILLEARRVPIPLARAGLNLAVVAGMSLFPLVVMALPLGDREQEAEEGARACLLGDLVPFLNEWSAARPAGSAVLLAPVWAAPELLFRTGVGVVATPHHRNADGILASHRIMGAQDLELAFSGIQQRGVSALVMCPDLDWKPLVRRDDEGTLYQRLVEGDPPPWLRGVQLPAPVSKKYSMWEVLSEGS
jgi:hypothetical protein